jgi:hypothetical protein
MRKRPLSIAFSIALAVAAVAASVAVAGTTTGSDGDSLTAAAMIKPKKLSKTAPTPATLEIKTKVSTTSPATQAVMDFDKNGTYLAKGLPTCAEKKLAGKTGPDAVKACKTAMIGTGSASAVVSFFGQPPIDAKATLAVFNGAPRGGKPTVLVHAYIKEPVENAFVFSGVVSKRKKEGFGTRLEIDFPNLFGGDGAVSEFNIKIQKTFTYKGKKRSLVSAKCPRGKKLKARIGVAYQDGEKLAVPVTQSCKQKS